MKPAEDVVGTAKMLLISTNLEVVLKSKIINYLNYNTTYEFTSKSKLHHKYMHLLNITKMKMTDTVKSMSWDQNINIFSCLLQ